MPYQSGGVMREQGISKAGNRLVRGMAVEIAWGWLRYQPGSKLSRWYQERFGHGGSQAPGGAVAISGNWGDPRGCGGGLSATC